MAWTLETGVQTQSQPGTGMLLPLRTMGTGSRVANSGSEMEKDF